MRERKDIMTFMMGNLKYIPVQMQGDCGYGRDR